MLATHEYKIMNSLKIVNHITPFFTSVYELVNLPINQNYEEAENPFELNTKYKYTVDVCISEYVDNARKLTTFIRHSKQVCDNIIISLVKQILIGLMIAHNNCDFSHYDIHSENVFVQKCSYNDVFVWYDKTTSTPYVIPSLGYIPRIIDYGFSYADGVKNSYIMSPLEFMREGYFSVHSDKFVDFKILLVSIWEEFYNFKITFVLSYRNRQSI
jgi:serine/threonine protein kinase